MTGRKLFAGVAVMALIFAACGGTDTTAATDGPTTTEAAVVTTTVPPTTTTTVPPTTTTTLSEEQLEAIQYEEDVKVIKTLWRRYSDSWSGGDAVGAQFITDNNHPLAECTGEDFLASLGDVTNYRMEVVVAQESIERDDGWPVGWGEQAGSVAEGRIYILAATLTDDADQLETREQTAEIHTVIGPGGTALFFFSCGT